MSVPAAPGMVRIPPPPPPARKRRGGDGRWIIWIFVLALGAGVGAAFYQWLPAVSFYFDYWIALLLR